MLISIVTFGMSADGDNTSSINLEHTHQGGTRTPDSNDEPAAYYNSDTQQVIIIGEGSVSYYDVEIVTQSTMATVVSTVVNGYYGIIDVSSVPSGDYTIVITSPNNNVYEGDFSIQ